MPADSVLLWVSNDSGTAYVRTDQLDGETDLKVREAIHWTQAQFDKSKTDVLMSDFSVKAEAPNDQLYEFRGDFTQPDGAVQPLQVENTLWSEMRVPSDEVVVMVTYTGGETRTNMNGRPTVEKFGKTDHEINMLFKVLFCVLVFLSFLMFFMAGSAFNSTWFIFVLRVFALFSSILPSMLKLNIDFAKLIYAMQITSDKSISGTVVRNSQIPEELGRVEILLSDKTGTLTKNEMLFKSLHTKSGIVTPERLETLREELRAVWLKDPLSLTSSEKAVREWSLALLLCNNVMPVWKDNERHLQGASPDEITLSQFAESLGLEVTSRRANTASITLIGGIQRQFEIVDNFPFTSERKRMGIILKDVVSDEHLFFVKGADSAIAPMLRKEDDRILSKEVSEQLSKQGLRTLVFALKRLTVSEYSEWKSGVKRATQDLKRRSEMKRSHVQNLEREMDLIGISAVEDTLQDGVKQTIDTLRSAGIKAWMVTGDKLETAKCIALSTGFCGRKDRFVELSGADESEIASQLIDLDTQRAVIVVGDQSLEVVLSSPTVCELFFKTAITAPAVILWRCAPHVKAEVADILRESMKKVVCCVGDGGNDTLMIKAASVGIGIEGKEGLQASLASDISVRQFSHLAPLFLWHGRLSYVRTAIVTKLVIHRGFLLTTIQLLFMALFHFVPIAIYSGYLNMFYGTMFTNWLVGSLVFEEDIPRAQAFNYPTLYRHVQEGGDLRLKSFLVWAFKAILQAALIMLLTVCLFESTLLELVTITFTALILTEYLTIATIVRRWHLAMYLGVSLSAVSYLFCWLVLPEVFLLNWISSTDLLKIGVLVLCSWAPIHLAYVIKRAFAPTTTDKILTEARIFESRKAVSRPTESSPPSR